MATSATNARLRRVTRRISELQAEQRELILQIGLEDDDESFILSTLELANEVHTFMDRVKGQPTTSQQRKGVTLARRLNRASTRLTKLPESDARDAAAEAAAIATEQLLSKIFSA